MKNLLSLSVIIGLSCILFLTGSFNKKRSSCFQTKADSINFAKSVVELYKSSEFKSANFKNPAMAVSTFSTNVFAPVKWDTIQAFATAYDASPIITSSGNSVRGFMIDEAGLTEIRKLDAKIITKLYLRFGRKPNQDYTVMILPVDSSGNVSKKDSANYDHLDPCPKYCTNNFQ